MRVVHACLYVFYVYCVVCVVLYIHVRVCVCVRVHSGGWGRLPSSLSLWTKGKGWQEVISSLLQKEICFRVDFQHPLGQRL